MTKYLLAAIAVLISSHLPAALIPNVAVQSVYSEFTSGTSDNRRATNAVIGAGLFGDVHTPVASGSMWLTLATTSGDFTNAFVTFDLGAVRTLDRMKVWNYNEAGTLTQRGIQRADILTAGEDLVFTTNLSNVLFERAPGAFTNFGQVINLSGTQARYVRFNVKTNHYVSGAAENRVGLSEVQFFDTTLPVRVEFASRNYSSNKVTVLFAESVTLASATNVANYSIKTDGTNSASILGAAFDLYNNRVVLQTTLLVNSSYTLHVSNVISAVDGTSTDGSPVSIEPEVVLWLKADSGITESGGLVSTWADQSGAGNNAAQNDPVFQPTLLPGALNGQPVVHFTGSAGFTNYMFVPHAPSLLVKAGDISIFAVMQFQTFNSFNTILSKINTNTQPAPFDGYVRASGQVTFLRGNGWGNNTLNGASNIITGQPYVFSFITRGTNGTEYVNGAFNGSVATTAAFRDMASPVAIGARTPAVADFGTRLDGDIAEMIVIRGYISDNERIAIHDYLGSKYGVPIVNLVFNEHPQNVTKLEGQTATFSVNVTANSPNISYQWQRGGTNIPNATNATYTTPILTLADNNSIYRVLVTVVGSSQFSDTATLMVIADTEQPTIIYAGRAIWDPSKIVVVFSEPLNASTALNSANYVVDNGAFVTGAEIGEMPNKVVLSTTGLTNVTHTLSVQNVQDHFGNSINAAQALLGIYPAAALWLKADAGVIADAAGLVSQWDDQSGNANNAMPFGGPETFPVLTNGFNNKPALRFGVDGLTNFLAISGSTSLALTEDMSLFIVASFADFSSHRTILSKTTLNQPAPYDFYLLSGTGAPRLVRGNGSASTIVTGDRGVSPELPHVIYATASGNSVAHYLDGNTNGVGTQIAPVADNGNFLFIGHRYTDAGTTMKGDIAEIILFGSSLSEGDRKSLENYLAAKYGLTLGIIPALSISTSGGSFVLSWPLPTSTFVLQSTTNLVAGGWVSVTNAVTSENGINRATIAPTEIQQFYRLHKQ